MNRDLPSIVIYHKNCTDGFAAATVFFHMNPNQEFVPVQYGEINTTDEFDALVDVKGKNVYIVDFSFSALIMQHIRDTAASMTWLDHHKTAFEMGWPVAAPPRGSMIIGEPDFYMCLDNDRSGAMLTWHFMHGMKSLVPDLIRFADDYDRWVFQYPVTRDYVRGLRSMPMSFPVWKEVLMNQSYRATEDCVRRGSTLNQEHAKDVAEATKHARPVTLLGHQGLAINSIPKLTSDAGHNLAYRSGTFGMIYMIGDKGRAKCSLRSMADFDVSVIAKHFGGGGHKNAAGFECSAFELLALLGVTG